MFLNTCLKTSCNISRGNNSSDMSSFAAKNLSGEYKNSGAGIPLNVKIRNAKNVPLQVCLCG